MESRLEEKPNHPAVYPNRFTPYPPTPPPPKKNAAKQQQKLGGGFKYLLFSPLLFWGRCPFDKHIFSNGLVQPPHIKITDSLSGFTRYPAFEKNRSFASANVLLPMLALQSIQRWPSVLLGDSGWTWVI